jgi:hypothetical protein
VYLDELLALFKPFPAEHMRAVPVDWRVGDRKNEDAGLNRAASEGWLPGANCLHRSCMQYCMPVQRLLEEALKCDGRRT